MLRIAKQLHQAAGWEYDQALRENAPDQALFRRAVSTACYAAFHYLIEKCIETVAPDSPATHQAAMARTFAHTTIKQFARRLVSPQPPQYVQSLFTEISRELRDLADAFVFLQEEREKADYDLSVHFTKSNAEHSLVALIKFFLVLDQPTSDVKQFLTLLPIAGQLRNR